MFFFGSDDAKKRKGKDLLNDDVISKMSVSFFTLYIANSVRIAAWLAFTWAPTLRVDASLLERVFETSIHLSSWRNVSADLYRRLGVQSGQHCLTF